MVAASSPAAQRRPVQAALRKHRQSGDQRKRSPGAKGTELLLVAPNTLLGGLGGGGRLEIAKRCSADLASQKLVTGYSAMGRTARDKANAYSFGLAPHNAAFAVQIFWQNDEIKLVHRNELAVYF